MSPVIHFPSLLPHIAAWGGRELTWSPGDSCKSWTWVSIWGDKGGWSSQDRALGNKCCSVAQGCLTLYKSMDCSPPSSSVHGILQLRILEWVAFPLPWHLPDLGIKLMSPVLQVDSLPLSHQRSPPPQNKRAAQSLLPGDLKTRSSLEVSSEHRSVQRKKELSNPEETTNQNC